MNILSGNLAEGKKEQTVVSESPQTQDYQRPSETPSNRRNSLKLTTDESVVKLEHYEDATHIRTFIRFTFGLDSFSIQLFTGDTQLVSMHLIVIYQQNFEFSFF